MTSQLYPRFRANLLFIYRYQKLEFFSMIAGCSQLGNEISNFVERSFIKISIDSLGGVMERDGIVAAAAALTTTTSSMVSLHYRHSVFPWWVVGACKQLSALLISHHLSSAKLPKYKRVKFWHYSRPGEMSSKSEIILLHFFSQTDQSFLSGALASLTMIVTSELLDKSFFIAVVLAMRHPR